MLEWRFLPTMERASKLIRGLRLPGDTITVEELARAAWPAAVGKTIAANTRASRMVRSRLIVEVDDRVWQRQLFGLTTFILNNLARNIGPGAVEELEFRIVPRRREPQRAARSAPSLPFDEAASIEDTLMRSIYRASRKRAQA
jgi:hypothetical protein